MLRWKVDTLLALHSFWSFAEWCVCQRKEGARWKFIGFIEYIGNILGITYFFLHIFLQHSIQPSVQYGILISGRKIRRKWNVVARDLWKHWVGEIGCWLFGFLPPGLDGKQGKWKCARSGSKTRKNHTLWDTHSKWKWILRLDLKKGRAEIFLLLLL